MIRNALAVIWKECREMPYQVGQGHAHSGWMFLATFLLLFGVIYPANAGAPYLRSEMAFLLPCLGAVFMINAAADSFAGERERHTLDALLASPLSDEGLLLGKIAAPMIFGWLTALAQILVGWISANAASRSIAFFDPRIFWSAVSITLALNFFISATCVLLSLRAATVRQAVQTATAVLFALAVLPAVVLRVTPSIRTFISTTPTRDLPLTAAGAMVVLGVVVSVIAAHRCRRDLLSLL